MTWIWNGFRLPMLVRLWRRRSLRKAAILDPQSLNAHWRRDLGFDR